MFRPYQSVAWNGTESLGAARKAWEAALGARAPSADRGMRSSTQDGSRRERNTGRRIDAIGTKPRVSDRLESAAPRRTDSESFLSHLAFTVAFIFVAYMSVFFFFRALVSSWTSSVSSFLPFSSTVLRTHRSRPVNISEPWHGTPFDADAFVLFCFAPQRRARPPTLLTSIRRFSLLASPRRYKIDCSLPTPASQRRVPIPFRARYCSPSPIFCSSRHPSFTPLAVAPARRLSLFPYCRPLADTALHLRVPAPRAVSRSRSSSPSLRASSWFSVFPENFRVLSTGFSFAVDG